MQNTYQNKQQGSVLITTLVILTAVTLIAVLGMQKSTTGVRMVGNTQLFENSFQIALSEINFTFNKYRQEIDTSELENAIQNPNSNQRITNRGEISEYSQSPITIETDINYKGSVNNIDHSLSGANSIGMIKEHNFTIITSATIPGANIGSTQEKEFSFLARKTN